MTSNKKTFLSNYKHALLFLYFPVYMLWFSFLEKHITTDYHIIHMNIDDAIPFMEIFVIPYFMWFGYVAALVMFFFFKDSIEFNKLIIYLYLGMTVFLIVSTIYPNGQNLRPETFARDNIFVQMVQYLYSKDTPTNIFPSIHCYNSICVHVAIVKSNYFKTFGKTVSFILMASIILSTMFLKQHSFFDVITAFLCAIVFYLPLYSKNFAKIREAIHQKWDKSLKNKDAYLNV